jgi:hypothetical protein
VIGHVDRLLEKRLRATLATPTPQSPGRQRTPPSHAPGGEAHSTRGQPMAAVRVSLPPARPGMGSAAAHGLGGGGAWDGGVCAHEPPSSFEVAVPLEQLWRLSGPAADVYRHAGAPPPCAAARSWDGGAQLLCMLQGCCTPASLLRPAPLPAGGPAGGAATPGHGQADCIIVSGRLEAVELLVLAQLSGEVTLLSALEQQHHQQQQQQQPWLQQHPTPPSSHHGDAPHVRPPASDPYALVALEWATAAGQVAVPGAADVLISARSAEAVVQSMAYGWSAGGDDSMGRQVQHGLCRTYAPLALNCSFQVIQIKRCPSFPLHAHLGPHWCSSHGISAWHRQAAGKAGDCLLPASLSRGVGMERGAHGCMHCWRPDLKPSWQTDGGPCCPVQG